MEKLTRRLFLGGSVATIAAATLVAAPVIVPPKTGLILPTKPEVIVDWLPCDGRAVSKVNYPELYNGLTRPFDEGKWHREKNPDGSFTWRFDPSGIAARTDAPFGEDALNFNLPGYGAGRLDGLSPSLAKEVSEVDFYIATRQVTLPSGLIVLPGTLMPKTT